MISLECLSGHLFVVSQLTLCSSCGWLSALLWCSAAIIAVDMNA